MYHKEVCVGEGRKKEEGRKCVDKFERKRTNRSIDRYNIYFQFNPSRWDFLFCCCFVLFCLLKDRSRREAEGDLFLLLLLPCVVVVLLFFSTFQHYITHFRYALRLSSFQIDLIPHGTPSYHQITKILSFVSC